MKEWTNLKVRSRLRAGIFAQSSHLSQPSLIHITRTKEYGFSETGKMNANQILTDEFLLCCASEYFHVCLSLCACKKRTRERERGRERKRVSERERDSQCPESELGPLWWWHLKDFTDPNTLSSAFCVLHLRECSCWEL